MHFFEKTHENAFFLNCDRLTFCDDPNACLTDANCASSIQGSSLHLVLGDLELTDACTLNTDHEETKIRGICGSLTHDDQHAAATVRSLTFTNLEVVGQDLTLEDLKFGVMSFPALVAVGEELELQVCFRLKAPSQKEWELSSQGSFCWGSTQNHCFVSSVAQNSGFACSPNKNGS